MKIVDYLKKFINKIKTKNHNQLILDSPKNLYLDLINSQKIDDIINNMPKNLSEIEKAYYIYLELGKIVSESPQFVFTDRKGKEEHYNDKIDDNYSGICKSISELYVSILRDNRIGISADLVRKYPESSITHVDVILKINGKNYIVNLISDLSRIKTSRRVNSFCFDLSRPNDDPIIEEENKAYLRILEEHYGKIDSLTRKEIEQLDKKLGYSFSVPQFSKDGERGIYTEDTIELLKKEMDNPESFKKYVLHNKDVPEEELLKYKLDYIFENINKLTDYNSNMNYLENIRYYLYVAKKILSPEEGKRIQAYVSTIGEDFSNIISILKVKPLNKSEDKNNNIYYIYSNEDKKYIAKTPEEMKQFIDEMDKEKLHIVGTFDRLNPQKVEELEL
ncbi:MAG: hypothetical protein ACI4UE_05815 [Candidatus Scatovivens sp.]